MHPVTQEIESGPNGYNQSGTLGGYGNLFSYIGFEEGMSPTEPLRRVLKKILKIHILAFHRFIFSKNIKDYTLIEFKTYILIKYVLGEEIDGIKKKFEKITENQIDVFSMH